MAYPIVSRRRVSYEHARLTLLDDQPGMATVQIDMLLPIAAVQEILRKVAEALPDIPPKHP